MTPENYSATIWSQPLSPCYLNNGCLPSQGSAEWFKNLSSWQGLKSKGGVWEDGDFFFFPDYITWPKHPLQLSEHFLFAQSCFQLRVRTNRKMRNTPEIKISFLHGIFSQSRYSCLSPQLGCSCEMTATSVWLFPTNNTRGNNPFCFKKKKERYRMFM